MVRRERQFELLGPLQVRVDGAAVQLGAKKQRALLVLLLLRANRPVRADELVELLWPERAPGRPDTAVQTYVSGLRRILGHDAIETSAGGYVVRVDDETLDSSRFERLLERGRDALAGGDARGAAKLLADALGLWRGDALADFAYEAWAQDEIRRLEELRLACLEQRLDADLALGRHDVCVPELEALAARHPARERLRRQLMLALYRAGRQADALSVYHETRSILRDELGLDPTPQLQTLYRRILEHDRELAAPAHEEPPATNLPLPPTPLVGRDVDSAEIVRLLGDRRLVTVTGAGGTGKTRLALHVAAGLGDMFPGGIFWIPLASVADPHLVLPTVALTLGVRETPDEPLAETLRSHVGSTPLLLVLDNFEHLLAAAPDVSDLLGGCPSLTVLVTSRTVLSLAGEQEYPLDPLLEADAIRLFAARAREVRPRFEPDDAVAEVCRLLDGLPLAIELAAARVRIMQPATLLERLAHALDLLTEGPRDLPERQRTMRAAVEWSYGLLDERDRRLFAQLAVFSGGWSIEAAEEVCGAGVDALTSLAAQSVVRVGPEGRFSMLLTIREFALELLDEMGESAATRNRHAAAFLRLAEAAAAELAGAGQAEWLQRLEQEHDNLRAALSWLVESSESEAALRLAMALRRFWSIHGHLGEGRRWLSRDLLEDQAVPTGLRAQGAVAAGTLARDQGEYAEARELLELGRALASQAADALAGAHAIHAVGTLEAHVGDDERAYAAFAESLELFRASGHARGAASALGNLGSTKEALGDARAAIELHEESLALWAKLGDTQGAAISQLHLGSLTLREQGPQEARPLLEESLARFVEIGDRDGVAAALEAIAAVCAREVDAERGAVLCGAAETIRSEIGAVTDSFDREARDRTLEALARHLSRQELEGALALGRSLTLERAVAYAAGADLGDL